MGGVYRSHQSEIPKLCLDLGGAFRKLEKSGDGGVANEGVSNAEV
jgi:hypothetical protein